MQDTTAAGAVFALLAYSWWGLTPLYWRELVSVPALEILAHRVVWTLLLVAVLLSVLGSWGDVRRTLAVPRRAAALTLSAGLLAVNWLVFIWAVNTDQVLAASLGYYLNPLFNVACGALFLRERLNGLQWLAVAIAALGVANMAWSLGALPWISVTLAVTFAIYGLIRKTVPIASLAGLTLESSVLAPFAIAWLAVAALGGAGAEAEPGRDGSIALLLVGGGVVTAMPLIWFASAARRLKLSTVGLFQYLSPSLNFVLAVALFGEAFTQAHAVTFGCIWVACALYAFSSR